MEVADSLTPAKAVVQKFESGELGRIGHSIWDGEHGLELSLVLNDDQRAVVNSVSTKDRPELVEYLMIGLSRAARGALADRLDLPPNQVFDGDLGRLALDVGLWFDFDGQVVRWEIPPEHFDRLRELLRGEKGRR